MVLPALGCELYIPQHFPVASPLTDGKSKITACYQAPPPVTTPTPSGFSMGNNMTSPWPLLDLQTPSEGQSGIPSYLHIHPRPPAPSILHVPLPGAWGPAEVLTLRGLQGPGAGTAPHFLPRLPPWRSLLASLLRTLLCPPSFDPRLHPSLCPCSLLAPRSTLPSWLLLLGLQVRAQQAPRGNWGAGPSSCRHPVSTCDRLPRAQHPTHEPRAYCSGSSSPRVARKNHLTDQDPLVCVASSLPPGHRTAQEARPSSLPFEQGDLQVTTRSTASKAVAWVPVK